MANYTTIGINWNTLSNLTPPDFNLTNKTTEELINQIPAQANVMTHDYYGIIVLSIVAIFLIWVLSERSQYAYFQYNNTRALGIALGICSTMGIMLVSIGYMTNFIHLGGLIGIYLIMLIYTIVYNPN